MDVSMSNGGTSLHPMAGLAILIGGKPPEKYLDWRALSDSYELAYQLLFARAMTEILKDGVFTSKQVSGRQEIHIQAVVMDPVFVYIVEAFLGIVSLSTAALLYLSLTRHRNLHSNPGTIASIMSLIADAPDVLLDFQQLDCCSTEGMKERIGLKRYQLVNLGSQSTSVIRAPTQRRFLLTMQTVLSRRTPTSQIKIRVPISEIDMKSRDPLDHTSSVYLLGRAYVQFSWPLPPDLLSFTSKPGIKVIERPG